jgi:hypothetical protein
MRPDLTVSNWRSNTLVSKVIASYFIVQRSALK